MVTVARHRAQVGLPLGYLSWKFIEIPSKGCNKAKNPNSIFSMLAACAVTIVILYPFFERLARQI